MKFTILDRKALSDIPSASGIEIMGDQIYVMGDDSPLLFRLNAQFEVTEKIPIGDIALAVGGKIPKGQKPDLEAMAGFGEELLLFGSGSKSPQRDVLVRLNTVSKRSHTYSLGEFYDSLCSSEKLTRNELNIEAAAISEQTLFLLNRGKNIIFKLNVQELLWHVEGKGNVPTCQPFRVTLPSLNGIEAGFSGATVTPDNKKMIFTASVENTPNWIDDGEVLGSFTGIFSVSELKDDFSPNCTAIADSEKNILKIKVESLAVKRADENGLRLWMVTDSDGTASEILEATFEP